jgi:predicted dehydrogenase
MNIAIIGTGKIIPTALSALTQIDGISVKAIVTRPHSKEKGDALAEQFGIADVYINYDDVLNRQDIDFIYVGIVNSAHYEYTRRALISGKNVIVEKPFCTTLSEAKEIADIAIHNGLYVFEAVTLLHTPNMQGIRESLPRLGKIKLVQCNYSQYSSRYDRYLQHEVTPTFNPNLGGGALMDLNVYNINFVIGLFGEPDEAFYFPVRGYNGIDTSGTLIMQYTDMIATCIAAKDSASPCYCTIQGEKGWLNVIGGPNPFDRYEITIGGQHEVLAQNRFEHRMMHEFIHFLDIYNQHDYDTMKYYLKLSLTEMAVISKATDK